MNKINIYCYPEMNKCEAIDEPANVICGTLKTDGKGDEISLEIIAGYKQAEELIKDKLREKARERKMIN